MIQTLDKETLLYPGHDYGDRPFASVDHELAHNPWLGYSTVEEFCTHRMKGKTPDSALPPRPDWTPNA